VDLDLRGLAGERPGTGACALANAMRLWLWTLKHVQIATDADARSSITKRVRV